MFKSYIFFCFRYANNMLISYYANKKRSPRLPSWQPSLIFFNIPIESGSIIKPCTLKHFQVTYRLHKAGYWTMRVDETLNTSVFNVNFCHFPEVWLILTATSCFDPRGKSSKAITSHIITGVICLGHECIARVKYR